MKLLAFVLFLVCFFLDFDHNNNNNNNNNNNKNYNSLFVLGYSDQEYKPGVPQTRVVALKKSNFEEAINDPANPFWLLKFYAPWCGHCQRLAPTLEIVASQTIGKMSIGHIDCTVEKRLCNEFKVRGYPTLMYSLDGNVDDYPGARDEKELLSFARRMARPAIHILQPEEGISISQTVENWLQTTEDGVGFVIWHPKTKPIRSTRTIGSDHDEMVLEAMQSDIFLQVTSQVARRKRAHAHFALLPSDIDVSDIIQPSESEEQPKSNHGFVVRMESRVKPKFFYADDATTATPSGEEGATTEDGGGEDETTMKDQLNEFVQVNNVPLVASLDGHKFMRISKLGRPIVLGVVDESNHEDVSKVKPALVQYASHPTNDKLRDKYYYGIMDGKKYAMYFQQYDINPPDLPVIFVVDNPTKTYWTNRTYFHDKTDSTMFYKSLVQFLDDIEQGIVTPAKNTGSSNGLMQYIDRLVGFHVPIPVFIVFVISLVAICFLIPNSSLIQSALGDDDYGDENGGRSSSRQDDHLLYGATGTTTSSSRSDDTGHPTTTAESKKDD